MRAKEVRGMKAISLVTFDLFGTLLDWQAYVEDAFPGRYDIFREASQERQQPGTQVLPYRNLLYEVALDLSPRVSREAMQFFAEGIGFAKLFPDWGAVQTLSAMAMTGAVSNCDFRHLVDVERALGHVFDFAVIAEEIKAYKPHAEAWDQILEHVTKKLGFDRREWLHVSAYVETDLAPAKERGIQTCFLPRPGGSRPEEALSPDLTADSLWELVEHIESRNGRPVRYSVKAACASPEVATDYIDWLTKEHGPDLLHVKGCQSFSVFEIGPTEVQCDYLFTSGAALSDYERGAAIELRRKGAERFPNGEVALTRSHATLHASVVQRGRSDFFPALKS